MKVYNEDTLIYNGTALGKDYNGSLRDLQKVVLLGEYGEKNVGKLRVVLVLDKDTPLKYADQLAQIDWKFIVEDASGEKNPKTGDGMNMPLYGAAALVSGIGVCILLCGQKKRRASR